VLYVWRVCVRSVLVCCAPFVYSVCGVRAGQCGVVGLVCCVCVVCGCVAFRIVGLCVYGV
jgi:hypothetical protein